jgi:hypothetical protein
MQPRMDGIYIGSSPVSSLIALNDNLNELFTVVGRGRTSRTYLSDFSRPRQPISHSAAFFTRFWDRRNAHLAHHDDGPQVGDFRISGGPPCHMPAGFRIEHYWPPGY